LGHDRRLEDLAAHGVLAQRGPAVVDRATLQRVAIDREAALVGGGAHVAHRERLGAGGRTLGLFSSRRAAEAAAEGVRTRLPDHEILCQGDAQLSELTRRFADEERTSLFGTLSLWQGIDLPGDTCRLVIIDRVPFPRPDDPLMSARQRLVEKRGGNGFMTVAASHAALLLAQGSGRLIRRTTDRGVVAVLDPRLVTARYGSFLAASLPPLWRTTDRDAVLGALRGTLSRHSHV
ncbi:MAG: hypothetical protein EON53_16395, partial [Actinomycetales bacterium]